LAFGTAKFRELTSLLLDVMDANGAELMHGRSLYEEKSNASLTGGLRRDKVCVACAYPLHLSTFFLRGHIAIE
jgi:hypothetical protein